MSTATAVAAPPQLSSQYKLDRGSPGSTYRHRNSGRGFDDTVAGAISELNRLVFDQARVADFVLSRPVSVLRRAAYLVSVATGIWRAWRERPVDEASGGEYRPTLGTEGRRATKHGEALRAGIAEMGVFFVKIAQTMAQRPDLVGDELAEELKGLQEKNAPFDDAIALKIIAEDLKHPGPLAPGVLWDGCDPSAPPLLAELDPRHVASASLGQVYRGRTHEGREVALKVQRPGVREVIGVDWAVAVLACRLYVTVKQGLNDYALIVDTVAHGIRQELDYHEEAANMEEFAGKHAFLPFVTSPAWIPELTGPKGSARLLGMAWYPSRAPKDLNREERRRLVEMAVEACIVQLLVTGFVHADPHEGNLRLGNDGRLVFLDFGLMDRVDFGVMECFAAGVKCVLSKDWTELTRIMQEVRFAPTPLLKHAERPDGSGTDLAECSHEEFAEVLREHMEAEEGGLTRFGAFATALKKMSSRYIMLTPPYVALLCRTFITLEGLLNEDPEMAENFNIYEVALPFALRRVLSPRTRKGQAQLRESFLRSDRRAAKRGGRSQPNWEAVASLIEDLAEEAGGAPAEPSPSSPPPGQAGVEADASQALAPAMHYHRTEDPFGATRAVQRRLLLTTEGAAIRRLLHDVDLFDALRGFLVSRSARRLRHKATEALAELLSTWTWRRSRAQPAEHLPGSEFGPRSDAASPRWGDWDSEDPYKLPAATLRSSRRAWRLVLRRQVRHMLWPPWRLPWRATFGLTQVALGSTWLGARALLRAVLLRWRRRAARRAAPLEGQR